MCEGLNQNEVISTLMKFIEAKYKSINEFKGRIGGVGTVIKFLLERMNNNIVESRIMTASDDFKSFEHKVDKICHRLDMLENKLLLIYNKWIVRDAINY